MSTVFVSYKSDDRERVRKLVASLRRSGLSVWWDQDIPPDADWEESITQALESSSCVIVCWSRKSVHSRTGSKVKAEARVAEEKDKLLQVLIDLVSPPLFFSEVQHTGLRNAGPGPARPHRKARRSSRHRHLSHRLIRAAA